MSALQAVPLPHYPFPINGAKNADLMALQPVYLGVLLESSEYEIPIKHYHYFSVTGCFTNYCTILTPYRLKIITHTTDFPVFQELTLMGEQRCQKMNFFIIPNLFEMSCI